MVERTMRTLAVSAALFLLSFASGQSRFELAAPLPLIPPVKIDALGNGVGVAQRTARAEGLQARILWVDGTANIERTNTVEKVEALIRQAKDAGFNTIVYDVKPISGQTLFPSKIAPKMLEWKGQKMPLDFDPLEAMSRAAKANGMPLLISANALSEGHSLFKVGPGYGTPELQTVIYDPATLIMCGGRSFQISETLNGPLGENGIVSITDTAKLPSNTDGVFAVSLRRDGSVVDGFEGGGIGGGVPTIPTGGAVLVGSGEGAAFLRTNALPGDMVRFDTVARFRPLSERPDLQYPLMMNPHSPMVRARAVEIAREIVGRYEVDGFVYDDRLRYAGIYADFSDAARMLFEKHVGQQIAWPDDVFKFTVNGPRLTRGIRPGRYYDEWMFWRAAILKGFVYEVRDAVKSLRPSASFGVYAGSWYGEYPAIGANYGGEGLDAGFWFLTREYARTGFAGQLDFLITGCYYPTPTIYEAMESGSNIGATIEGAGMLSNRVVDDQTWTYAGLMLSQFKGDPDRLERALQAACASTQGVMVFDLSHEIEPFWAVFKKAFSTPAAVPHGDPKAILRVRKARKALEASGYRPPAVPILAGTAGTGF